MATIADASDFTGQPVTGDRTGGSSTVIEGTTFCISAPNGDIEPGGVEGLFVRDTRFCSRFTLRIDGATTQALSTVQVEPFAQTFVSRVRPSIQRPDPAIVVVRQRYVGDGMREDLEIRNLGTEEVELDLLVELAADFAHLFDVKDDRVRPRGFHSVEATETAMVFAFKDHGRSRQLSVCIPQGADAGPGFIARTVTIAPRGVYTSCFSFVVELDGRAVAPRHVCGEPVAVSEPAARLREWRWHTPRVQIAHEGFSTSLARSEEDLGALRIFDPDRPDEPIIAAGAPWYMALFGRDSLISSWMTLPVDPRIAEGTLRTLARQQGTVVNVDTEEQPGKILHELRFRIEGPPDGKQAAATAYFGSIDSTPLFVMLLGEARRFGLDRSIVEELLPHADRAIEWIEKYGDRDGDGLVEYARLTDAGFPNQGWKDSTDGVNFASGELPKLPIALCEVQGYVYAAYVARYHLAREFGDAATARHCAEKAQAIRAALNERFWLADRGYFAIGLDGDKKPIDALASNMGHLLWTGVADDDKAASVAKHLLSPELFSGWGVRTLASTMGAFNPMSYHNGSVWPHDNAIIASGLMRYGFVEEAQRIAIGIVDAAEAFGGQLPELFCGFDRSEFFDPITYPTACSPQAWASAALFLLVRTLLRYDPVLTSNEVYFAPAFPRVIPSFFADNIPLGNGRLTMSVGDQGASLVGLPDSVTLRSEPVPVHFDLSA